MKKGQGRLERQLKIMRTIYRQGSNSADTRTYHYFVRDTGAYMTLWSVNKKTGTKNRDLEIFFGYSRAAGDAFKERLKDWYNIDF